MADRYQDKSPTADDDDDRGTGRRPAKGESEHAEGRTGQGGGLDVQLNNRIGVRVFQIDYNPVFLRDRSISVVGQGGAVQTQTLESNRQDNLRIGVGVLIR